MKPVVGLLVRPGVPRAAVAFLAELQRHADVRAESTGGRRPRAHVATSPTAPGLDRVLASGEPVCVWVDGPEDVAAARHLGEGSVLFLTDDRAVVDSLDAAAVLVTDPGAVPDLRPVSPLVRERWRRRAGFPADWVVTVHDGDDPGNGALGAAEDLVPTALAVAAAAVVRSTPAARTGLGLGCPMVVDERTAADLSIVDGLHALVEGAVGSTTGDALARLLVEDMALSASLSRAGRALFDDRHGGASALRRVVEHLGLVDPSPPPGQRFEDRLDELHTGAHARARHRGRELLAGLPGAESGGRT